MKYIDSTYEILAYKALNWGFGELWIDWAIEMVENGHESEHLLILAGIGKVDDQFYLRDLTTRVLRELSLDYSSIQVVLYDYVVYLACEMMAGKRDCYGILETLKEIYLYHYHEPFKDFYLLSLAQNELAYSTDQHYWPGATVDNIDAVVAAHFEEWIQKHRPTEN